MTPTYQFPELPVLHGAALAHLTDEEFFQLCQDNPQFQLERDAHFNLIIMPPSHPDASESGGEVVYQMNRWNRTLAPVQGHTYESSAGFKLANGAIRAPDASWLSRDRRTAAAPAGGFLAACPEFVVEILSPTDRLATTQAKMEEYLANGVQLGFLLDVAAETAYVYRPGRAPETVPGFDRELSGEPVLPGFALDLRPLRRKQG